MSVNTIMKKWITARSSIDSSAAHRGTSTAIGTESAAANVALLVLLLLPCKSSKPRRAFVLGVISLVEPAGGERSSPDAARLGWGDEGDARGKERVEGESKSTERPPRAWLAAPIVGE
jgi:hypothetical protein